jgi:hypothetical protein
MKKEAEIESIAANVICSVVGVVSWGLLAAGPLGFFAIR